MGFQPLNPFVSAVESLFSKSKAHVLGDGAPRGAGLLSLLYIVFFWGGLGEGVLRGV